MSLSKLLDGVEEFPHRTVEGIKGPAPEPAEQSPKKVAKKAKKSQG